MTREDPIKKIQSEEYIADIEQVMETLQEIVTTGDNDRFSAFIDHQAFTERVQNSGQLSRNGSNQFFFQFRNWLEIYLPISQCTIHVEAIVPGDAANEFIVYTWLSNLTEYPEPAAWYFQRQQGSYEAG